MYCTCKKKDSFTAAPKLDGGPYELNYSFWVCSQCLRPSRLVFIAVTSRYVPRDAVAFLSLDSDGEGRQFLTWAGKESGDRIRTMVFIPYPRKIDMPNSQGRDVLVELWNGLDSMIDDIRKPNFLDQQQAALRQAEARILAKVISLIMAPFYEDDTAVLRESMARWTARKEKRDHESPGLAESIWDPATRFDGTPYDTDAAPAPVKSIPVLDETKANFVRHQLNNGLMDVNTLATMFEVPVESIQACTEVDAS